jgi:hypothetical protein
MKGFDKLNDAFEIEEIETTEIEVVTAPETQIVVSRGEDVTKDYASVRSHLTNLISKGQEIIDGAMEAAESSGHPRAYEVASNAVRNTSEVVDKLMDLHKKMKDIEKDEIIVNNTNVQNNFFTMAEIMSSIKEENKKLNSDKRETE